MKKLLFALVLMVPMLAFTGCGGDDDEPDVPDQILNVGQVYTIPVDGSWSSENDFIASVEGKTVKGVRVGEVTISNGDKSFNVQVNPTITLYKDPFLDFGASKQSVRNYMNWANEGTEKDESLTFGAIVDGSVVGYHYTFENGSLDTTMVMAQSTIASAERFADYLSQRFVAAGEKDGIIMMVTPDKKIAVGVTVKSYSGNIMYITVYIPFTSSKTRSDIPGSIKDRINSIQGEILNDKVAELLYN